MLVSAAVAGSMAVGPAYGQQSQTSGVGNSGTASASTGGNSSAGNSSSNVASNAYTQTTTPTTSPPVLGSVLGLVLNLSGGSGNSSGGTSNITTGPAAAAGNTSDTGASQTQASAPGGGGGGSPIVLGSIYNPFINPFYVPPPAQSSGVTNSGSAAASTGGNSGVGNNSTNVASNNQTVNAGLIGIGLQLGNTATNTSNGTSTINTGAATAAGNQSTTAVDQARIGGGPGGPGGFGPLGYLGIGGGVQCDGFFRFGGQRVDVGNTGTARADTGGNASVGNQSQNVASNESNVTGGLINVDVPGLLSNTATNASDGTSNINTGAATAAGNRATTSVDQSCVEPVRVASPPPVRPGIGGGSPYPDGFRIGVGPRGLVLTGNQVRPQQLARTGRDPFVMGLIAFSLLFGGLMFLVWEKVEAYPKRTA